MLLRRLAYSFILFILCASVLPAQETEKTDSLVRLLGCDELQQVEQFGWSFRKALGHARFEHNSTLLVCDTAIWNVNSNVIKAYGNVRIIQNETVLSSDKLDYLIDENLAKFRGTVVQLQDKQQNTLRTKDLDYNTKDSVATFKNGGAMRDKDGQVIESKMGSYESKFKTFIFTGDVNMYTDSIFVKTDRLEFNAEISKAYFGHGTNAWKDSGMLSSNAGWYDRNQEIFLFNKNVHLMTPNQEAWSDSLKYYRNENNVEMFGNVELLDTTRNVSAVAGYMQYIDSLKYIRMTRDPAVIAISEQNGQVDTTYVGADTLVYWTVKKCDVAKGELAKSEKRLGDINTDAVTAYRRSAYEKAKEAAEQTKKKMLEEDPNAFGDKDPGKAKGVGKGKAGRQLPAPFDEIQEYDFPEYSFAPDPPDSLTAASDSLAVADSTAAVSHADSSAVKLDTTKIGFLLGLKNVKVFRRDMQVACDSLEYNDLDSLVRLYKQPVVWNEIDRQYSADSIFVVIKNRALEKANLMSEAFIVIKQDSICFDQIKGAEMMAYFDSTGALSRFDSMGGASGVFFIEENGVLATVNKFEAKMLTAIFKNGDIHDLSYFEEAKTDAYPLVQLQRDERVLKGFLWQPENRPADPEAVTSYGMRQSQREKFSSVKRPEFKNTDIYFPGYMDSVHKMLATQDSIKRARRLQADNPEPPVEPVPDMTSESAPEAVNDSIPAPDPALDQSAVRPDEEAADLSGENAPQSPADSAKAAAPSLKFPSSGGSAADSLKAAKQKQKEEKAAQKKAAADEKAAAKEARWAEKDAKDAVKAEKKAARDLARKRKSTLAAVLARDKREAKEQKILERYQARYEKRKARRDSRHPDTEAVPSKKKEKAPDILTPPEDKGIQSLGGKEKQIYVE